MKVGSLEVVFHRTVRVADGRTPSNLPPSLGTMKAYKVSDYPKTCPKAWEDDAVFVALHDTEALWLSFNAGGRPMALLVGAGGINALTGEKLGTKLDKDNYIVTPPQPWLDGWKSEDGCVYQFVATPYEKGEGKTVAEQLIGKESKTGAIGLAVFESKDPRLTVKHSSPVEGYGTSPFDGVLFSKGVIIEDCAMPQMKSSAMSVNSIQGAMRSSRRARSASASPRRTISEMGIGKGGKIRQKVYPDPYGLETWQDSPVAAVAVYVVNAEAFEEITGEKIPKPVGHESYKGVWFGLKDEKLEDVGGTNKFTGLDTAFAGDTTNVKKKAKTAK